EARIEVCLARGDEAELDGTARDPGDGLAQRREISGKLLVVLVGAAVHDDRATRRYRASRDGLRRCIAALACRRACARRRTSVSPRRHMHHAPHGAITLD